MTLKPRRDETPGESQEQNLLGDLSMKLVGEPGRRNGRGKTSFTEYQLSGVFGALSPGSVTHVTIPNIDGIIPLSQVRNMRLRNMVICLRSFN